MKKFLLLPLTLCSFAAQAQEFQNPFIHKLGEFGLFGVSVSVNEGDNVATATSTPLPKDTVMPLGQFMLSADISWESKKEHTEADVDFLKTIAVDFQIHDYYGRNVQKMNGQRADTLLHYQLDSISPDFFDYGDGQSPAYETIGTEIAGHYDWSWTANNGIEGMSGHVQFNADPTNSVWGTNGTSDSHLIEFEKLTIRSKFNTGFPYNIAKYQGKAKYTIYNPDSVMIGQQEIDLRISADSTMNSQVQSDIVWEVDSARHGAYHVILEAPFLDKPQTWRIDVEDPLADASSQNPVNATYRLAESNFKAAGKGKGWKYSGSVQPTYYTDTLTAGKSVMVVRPDANSGGNAFSLTQRVGKMPQGFYKLTVPLAYQPCALNGMLGNVEMLASFEANGYTRKAKHILAGASVQTTQIDGMEYTSYVVPSSNESFAECLNKYAQSITFEVKEDSLITIGVHKNHTDSLNEITAIGAVDLVYYGAGLPYGEVAFPEDALFAVGDSVKTAVKLYDGVGHKVFSDNKIMLFIAPLTQEGTIDREHVILDKEVDATEAGFYDMSVVLPEDVQYPTGEYVIIVGSLPYEGKYEVLEQKPIQIKGTTAIEEVKSAALEAAPIYSLSGVRQRSNANVKGMYIQGGKKFLKQ